MANLALNKSATASSFVKPYTAGRAVDGSISPTSRWLCNTLPGYMVVDLGANYWINRWVVKHMGSVVGWQSPNYIMADYSLQGSNNNSVWGTIDTVSGNASSSTDRTFTPIQYRYVRLYVTKGLNFNPKLASCMELEVYEAPHSSALLNALTISRGTLTPNFASTALTYSTVVTDASITVTPTAVDSSAKITVNNVIVTSGQASTPIPLNIGNNVITIVVTGAIGGDQVSYTLNVTRVQNLYLTKVNLAYTGRGYSSSSTVTMDHTNLSYSDATSKSASQVTVTPYAEDNAIAINVNGQNLSSGSTSTGISVPNTSNNIAITVTYPGDSGSRNYVLTISKS